MEIKSKNLKGFFISNKRENIECENNHVYSVKLLEGSICIMGDYISSIVNCKNEVDYDKSNVLENLFTSITNRVSFATCPMLKSKDNPNLYISVDESLAFSNKMEVLIDHLSNTILGTEDYFKVKHRKDPLYALCMRDMSSCKYSDDYYYDNKHIYFKSGNYIDFISIDHLNECELDNPLNKAFHFYNNLDMLANYMIEIYESFKDEFESYNLSSSRKTFKEIKNGDFLYVYRSNITNTDVTSVIVNEIKKQKSNIIIDTNMSFFVIQNPNKSLNCELIVTENEDDEDVLIFTTKESFLEYRLAKWKFNMIKSFMQLGVDLSKLHV